MLSQTVPFSNPELFGLALYASREQSMQWYRWEDKMGLANPALTDRKGRPPGNSHGGRVDWTSMAHWGIYHFGIHAEWDAALKCQQMDRMHVRLSDQGVFWAMCTLLPDQRKLFTLDFDSHGDIRINRVPKDPPMIIWCSGLPWFPVYKDAYILCGTWRNAGYLLPGRVTGNESTGVYRVFRVGTVLAPADAVAKAREHNPHDFQLKQSKTQTYPVPGIGPWSATTDIIEIARRHAVYVEMHEKPDLFVLMAGIELTSAMPLAKIPGYNPRVCAGAPLSLSQEKCTELGIAHMTAAPYALSDGQADPKRTFFHWGLLAQLYSPSRYKRLAESPQSLRDNKRTSQGTASGNTLMANMTTSTFMGRLADFQDGNTSSTTGTDTPGSIARSTGAALSKRSNAFFTGQPTTGKTDLLAAIQLPPNRPYARDEIRDAIGEIEFMEHGHMFLEPISALNIVNKQRQGFAGCAPAMWMINKDLTEAELGQLEKLILVRSAAPNVNRVLCGMGPDDVEKVGEAIQYVRNLRILEANIDTYPEGAVKGVMKDICLQVRRPEIADETFANYTASLVADGMGYFPTR